MSTVGENAYWFSMEVCKNLKLEPPYDPEIPLVCIYPKKIKT